MVQTSRNVYGAVYDNGLNFVKSVNDPYSNLSRVLGYLRTKYREGFDGVTKRDILIDVFGMTPIKNDVGGMKTRTNHTISLNTWGTGFFSTAVKCGFLKYTRRGNTVVWSLGPKHDMVKTR